MPAAMNALDCLVLPQAGTEAIPGVICEAHACGKPVMAWNSTDSRSLRPGPPTAG